MFFPAQFGSQSIRAHPRGASVTRILAAAYNAAHAGDAVSRRLQQHPLPPAQRVFALGLGKASPAMMTALAKRMPLTGMALVAKHAADVPPGAQLYLGNHPVPGEGSLRAGEAALQFVSQLSPQDLLVCLISGGGSALMAAPLIPLAELQRLTSALLANGARIDQMNALRRHLDELKGGGLAAAAKGARITSLILSDVVGDSLETIASGVTAPDPSTVADAQKILNTLAGGGSYPLRETLKPGDPLFERVENVIIASNAMALQAAKRQAEEEGFHAEIVASDIQGEAREVGENFAAQLRAAAQTHTRPFCLLAGGETTVTLKGNGRGGRNQETALGAVNALRGLQDVTLIAIATDGEDGTTDAAGAAVTGESAARAESSGLQAEDCLQRNDSYAFFSALGDLIQPGASGTNVNDLILLLGF